MLDEGIEITITIKERKAVLDTSGGDERVNRLPNGDSASPEQPEIPGGLNSDVMAANVDLVERSHQPQRLVEIMFTCETLKHFGQYDVANRQRLTTEQSIQPVRLGSGNVAKIIDPDA